jgi:energy-coupling factor transport system ATP-binding protein
MIELHGLSVCFGDKKALDEVNLNIETGEFVSILGANGCGKTTLALCMAGLMPAFFQSEVKGDIFLDGTSILNKPVHETAKKIGLLMQDYQSQIFFQTPREEIIFSLENFGLPKKGIHEVSEETGLGGLLGSEFSSMSEGQKQKAVLASLLAVGPDILLLDEPSSQLDREESKRLLGILKRLNNAGKTIIAVTHDTQFAKNFSRFIVMHKGRIMSDFKNVEGLSDKMLEGYSIDPLGHNWGENKAMPEGKPLLTVENLSYRYAHGKQVLKDLNMEVGTGECVLITGKNGSGKTTLIKHLIKLLELQEGRIELGGKSLRDYKQKELAEVMGVVFQNPDLQLFRHSVKDELLGRMKTKREEGDLKHVLGIEEYFESSPQALSTGEKQKVAIAAALAAEPRLILLDEPMTYLDFNAKKKLIREIKRLKKDGTSFIIVTHHERYYSGVTDRIVRLK